MRRIAAFAVALSLVQLVVLPVSAQADGPTTTVVAEGFVGPLDIAVTIDRTVYVTELGTQLTRIGRRGERRVVATGGFAGVDARLAGAVTVTESVPPEDPAEPGPTYVSRVLRDGSVHRIADLLDHETATNPDAGQTYGFDPTSTPACLSSAGELGLAPYSGIVESNPYGVAVRGATRIVADAAGNSIVEVGPTGRVRTLAVLPPQAPVLFTEELRQGLVAQNNEGAPPEQQLPPDALVSCVGATYTGEPVPTDVEIGPRGELFVSGLPGFPELPGSGSVYRIDRQGTVSVVATGFSGAVDLAVARDGTIYVAELFGGQVSKVVDGQVVATLPLDSPSAVEITRDGTLYVATGAFGPSGSVVTTRF